MKPILFSLFDSERIQKIVNEDSIFEVGDCLMRSFPDGETYFKLNTNVQNRSVYIIDSLDFPNSKILPLLFAADALREEGASHVGLIAPYLSYMRQDKQFQTGEAVTSKYFAGIISKHFDSLATIEPHLHRYHTLDEIYTISNKVLQTDKIIAEWINYNISSPILIGPDQESEQWVKKVASHLSLPFIILTKIRRGDHEVEIQTSTNESFGSHTPVILDDIISTGRTTIEVIKYIKKVSKIPPVSIAIHGVFSHDAYQDLIASGASQVVTCNTIQDPSNKIDINRLIVDYIVKPV